MKRQSFIIIIISVLSILTYTITYNSDYSLLKESIDSKDYESSIKLIKKIDRYPLKIKSINEFKASIAIYSLDSLPNFNLVFNLRRRPIDSIEIRENLKIITNLNVQKKLLQKSDNVKLKLEYDVLISNLHLRNINRINYSANGYIFGDKSKDSIQSESFFNKTLFESEQHLLELRKGFDKYESTYIDNFKQEIVNTPLLSPLHIIAYMEPTIENIKNYTGVDLSQDRYFSSDKSEQEKMSKLINHLNDDLFFNQTRYKESVSELNLINDYDEEIQVLFNLFNNYIDYPILNESPYSIRSFNYLKLVLQKYLGEYTRLRDVNDTGNLGYYYFEESPILSSKQRKAMIRIIRYLIYDSEETSIGLKDINYESDALFQIYNWYRTYLEDTNNNYELLRLHKFFINLDVNKLELSKLKLSIFVQFYYSNASVKFDNDDWSGAISSYDEAIKYINFINNPEDIGGNNTTVGSIYLGISKADILVNRGIAKYNMSINKESYKLRKWCSDLKTASELQASKYDTYVKLCITK